MRMDLPASGRAFLEVENRTGTCRKKLVIFCHGETRGFGWFLYGLIGFSGITKWFQIGVQWFGALKTAATWCK